VKNMLVIAQLRKKSGKTKRGGECENKDIPSLEIPVFADAFINNTKSRLGKESSLDELSMRVN